MQIGGQACIFGGESEPHLEREQVTPTHRMTTPSHKRLTPLRAPSQEQNHGGHDGPDTAYSNSCPSTGDLAGSLNDTFLLGMGFDESKVHPSSRVSQAVDLYFQYCHRQPIWCFDREEVKDPSYISEELACSIVTLTARFSQERDEMQHYGDTARTLIMLRIANGSVELETLESLCLLSYSSFLGKAHACHQDSKQPSHDCQMEIYRSDGSTSASLFSSVALRCLMSAQHTELNVLFPNGNEDCSGAFRYWSRHTAKLIVFSACHPMCCVLFTSRPATTERRGTLSQNLHHYPPTTSVALIPAISEFGAWHYTSAGSGVESGRTSSTAHKVD